MSTELCFSDWAESERCVCNRLSSRLESNDMFELDNLSDVIVVAGKDCCFVEHFLKRGSLLRIER